MGEIPQRYENMTKTTRYPPLTLSSYSELIKSKQTFLLVYTTIFTYLISAWNTPDGIVIWELIWITISLFFVIMGVLVPYINDSYGSTMAEYDVAGVGSDLVDSDTSSTVTFWSVIFSVISMFFWTFGGLPVAVDLIVFVPLRLMLIKAVVSDG